MKFEFIFCLKYTFVLKKSLTFSKISKRFICTSHNICPKINYIKCWMENRCSCLHISYLDTTVFHWSLIVISLWNEAHKLTPFYMRNIFVYSFVSWYIPAKNSWPHWLYLKVVPLLWWPLVWPRLWSPGNRDRSRNCPSATDCEICLHCRKGQHSKYQMNPRIWTDFVLFQTGKGRDKYVFNNSLQVVILMLR